LNVTTSNGWNVEYPLVGDMVGEAGCPGPAPVTLKLRAADHALCTNELLTACTRQKYVPFGRPLTVSCVWPLVELCNTVLEKVDEVLTCQLYPRMPLGSDAAAHEMVKGVGKFAPAAGDTNVGVDTAAAGLATASMRTRIDRKVTAG
jgi:hypothetical protein